MLTVYSPCVPLWMITLNASPTVLPLCWVENPLEFVDCASNSDIVLVHSRSPICCDICICAPRADTFVGGLLLSSKVAFLRTHHISLFTTIWNTYAKLVNCIALDLSLACKYSHHIKRQPHPWRVQLTGNNWSRATWDNTCTVRHRLSRLLSQHCDQNGRTRFCSWRLLWFASWFQLKLFTGMRETMRWQREIWIVLDWCFTPYSRSFH